MSESTIVRTIWLGSEYVSIGDTKIMGKEMMFRKIGGLPFFNPFIPTLANAERIIFQERKLWIPRIGDTGITVRIYLSDLRLDKFYAWVNPQDINRRVHKDKLITSLKLLVEEYQTMLFSSSGEDVRLKQMKRLKDLFDTARGFNSGYSGSYGSSLPFNSNVGGGSFDTPSEQQQF